MISDLPSDILSIIFLYLPYIDIINNITLCRKINKLLQSEFFWQQYVESRAWIKDCITDTSKQTAMLQYFGKYEVNERGKIILEICWFMHRYPNNLRRYNGYVLSKKDYLKIVFRQPVKLIIPFLLEKTEDNQHQPKKEFQLEPDTSVGSTLKHTLEEIYLKTYGLSIDNKFTLAYELNLKCNIGDLSPEFNILEKRNENVYEVSYISC